MSSNYFLGTRKHFVQISDDSRDTRSGLRGQVSICVKMLGNDLRSGNCPLLCVKESVDVGATPLDQPLELWQVWNVTPLNSRQRVERHADIGGRVTQAQPPP